MQGERKIKTILSTRIKQNNNNKGLHCPHTTQSLLEHSFCKHFLLAIATWSEVGQT